ncbi:hypothetical protein DFS34DRAFT_653793 [Phlyctochytrium arcticum]|nr:hypothetical protein DFS34DRAFT_653793 [Phlyctochytrium arcticum]
MAAPAQADFSHLYPLLHESVHALASSPWMYLLHSVSVAYTLRKTLGKTAGEPALRGVFRHCLVSLGGSSLAAILTARPIPILLSNTTLPLYILGHVLIWHLPLIYPFLSASSLLIDPLFLFLDGFVRAWALTANLNGFRNHPSYGTHAQATLLGQVLLGIVSLTAGGLMWKWAGGMKRFEYPGWDFTVIGAVVGAYVLAVNEYEMGWGAGWDMQKRYGKLVGVPHRLSEGDMRVLAGLVMGLGFVIGRIVPLTLTSGTPRSTRPPQPASALTVPAARPAKTL